VYAIEALYLNKCGLTDNEAILLLQSVKDCQNHKVRKIYLNDNHLKNGAALKMAELLLDPGLRLKEIGLKWNQITAIGGNAIAKALEDNKECMIFDISWNSIGIRPSDKKKPLTIPAGEVGKAWGGMFLKNETLIHLDLSFNKIQ